MGGKASSSMNIISEGADTEIYSDDLRRSSVSPGPSISSGMQNFRPFRDKYKRVIHKPVDPLEQAIAATKMSK